ncbi:MULTISPECIES: flavodoxin [Pseudomonas]|jgi:MioC protein|uniref:Flavodoxin n=1 Tax=Pseudomonas flavocrustae TaxID=2991719 RepID=A0ABT6IMN1_9PSED|nr:MULTISPECIES: flavodoxin [Pseudomonas]MDH4765724.1 flavodoxin [Pseudomonas sp. CBMAI 2609]MDK8263729.1 flavodoxin [Pseudomonas oryzihabitans]
MKVALLNGSVYGTAEDIARQVKSRLTAAGHEVWHQPNADLGSLEAFAPEALLAITSTTGMGELPANLESLYFQLRDRLPPWSGRPGAVLALGDSSYGDTYCGGGELMQELFAELGLRELLPMLRIDASETVTPDEDAERWVAEVIAALG